MNIPFEFLLGTESVKSHPSFFSCVSFLQDTFSESDFLDSRNDLWRRELSWGH